MPDKIFKALSEINSVTAVALGGSRSGDCFDESSDYDVYVYTDSPIPEKLRKSILEESCSYSEVGNHFWEYEDNCVLKSGCDIDIIYRSLDGFAEEVSRTAEKFEARNGYTTCMWHNLITSKIIFDRDGRLARCAERFKIPYPEKLKANIISRNMKLLDGCLPSYTGQIRKAAKRGDIISVNHRAAEFFASYFDVIFALNEKTHPGEKRLVELCLKMCPLLPRDFEKNLRTAADTSIAARDPGIFKILSGELAEIIPGKYTE